MASTRFGVFKEINHRNNQQQQQPLAPAILPVKGKTAGTRSKNTLLASNNNTPRTMASELNNSVGENNTMENSENVEMEIVNATDVEGRPSGDLIVQDENVAMPTATSMEANASNIKNDNNSNDAEQETAVEVSSAHELAGEVEYTTVGYSATMNDATDEDVTPASEDSPPESSTPDVESTSDSVLATAEGLPVAAEGLVEDPNDSVEEFVTESNDNTAAPTSEEAKIQVEEHKHEASTASSSEREADSGDIDTEPKVAANIQPVTMVQPKAHAAAPRKIILNADASLQETADFLIAAVARTRARQKRLLKEGTSVEQLSASAIWEQQNVGSDNQEKKEHVAPTLSPNDDSSRRQNEDLKSAMSAEQTREITIDEANGSAAGLTLEPEPTTPASGGKKTAPGVLSQIANINKKCATNKRMSFTSPPEKGVKHADAVSRSNKDRQRRASTGEIVRSRVYPKGKKVTASANLQTNASPSNNTRNLLKTYNKDLYYSNELSRLINVDPCNKSSKPIDFEKVKSIVKECPSVCRAKYDLTFNGEKQKLYPLFSLVPNKASLELVKMVFFENPFMFLEVRDTNGATIMHYATAFDPLPIETLTFLIHRSAHSLDAYDIKKRSPLHTVCANPKSEPEAVQYLMNESPLSVISTRDSEGKLPLELALANPHCPAAIKKSFNDRAKAHEEELKQAALKKQEQEEHVAKLEASHLSESPKFTAWSPKNGSKPVDISPKNVRVGSPTPEMIDIPNPSFWERLCCRPVI